MQSILLAFLNMLSRAQAARILVRHSDAARGWFDGIV